MFCKPFCLVFIGLQITPEGVRLGRKYHVFTQWDATALRSKVTFHKTPLAGTKQKQTHTFSLAFQVK